MDNGNKNAQYTENDAHEHFTEPEIFQIVRMEYGKRTKKKQNDNKEYM